ncbi:MAG: hypothetical protein ACXVZV_14150 [Terriglobales bacterium]
MNPDRRFGTSWLVFAFAVALHVSDEATHDFLSVYNPMARMVRERFGIPIPVFTFEVWVISLLGGVCLLMVLTPLAFRGVRWLRVVAVPLTVIVGIFNAVLHLAMSLYFHRRMPGVYSAPILLAAAVFLLYAATSSRKSLAASE